MDGSREQLRKLLLERRDCTSADLLGIAAGRIVRRLRGIPEYMKAGSVGAYCSIGSEIDTRDIIQEVISEGREALLPRVEGDTMTFRRISGISDLEEGAFGIMEPRESCRAAEPGVVLVPAVGVSPDGARLGYGRGYYDRYLAKSGAAAIALVLQKQVVSRIPGSEGDVPMDWIVTEDKAARTGAAREGAR